MYIYVLAYMYVTLPTHVYPCTYICTPAAYTLHIYIYVYIYTHSLPTYIQLHRLVLPSRIIYILDLHEHSTDLLGTVMCLYSAYTHTCRHTYIHTYMHMYTYIQYVMFYCATVCTSVRMYVISLQTYST